MFDNSQGRSILFSSALFLPYYIRGRWISGMEREFWVIIDKAKKKAESIEDRANQLRKLLMEMSAEDIIWFDNEYLKRVKTACEGDLWGASCIISGNSSEDTFFDFCAFLISEGEQIYTRAVTNAENLADEDINDAELEIFNYVASDVYAEKTGEEIPSDRGFFSPNPIGAVWDEASLNQRFPVLINKYL